MCITKSESPVVVVLRYEISKSLKKIALIFYYDTVDLWSLPFNVATFCSSLIEMIRSVQEK
jgi:hypothetical protein